MEIDEASGDQTAIGDTVGMGEVPTPAAPTVHIHRVIRDRDDIGMTLSAQARQQVVLGENVFADNAV